MKPFRFGISTPSATTRAAWVDEARRIESLGFDVLSSYDHLEESLQPLVALAVAAEATTTLRVGTLVLNNDLRHPALLAREVATLDVLSNGRFELGMGAGHSEPEYRQIGLPFDAAPTRVERLEESVAIVKSLLRGDEVSVTGKHYTLTNHRGHPKPAQRPAPLLLIGGNGRRLLRLAAREADIVGFTGLGRTLEDGQHHEPTGFAPVSVVERVELVRRAAGDRLSSLEFQALVQAVRITDDRRGAAEEIAARLPPLTAEDVLGSPFLLVGTVDEIAHELIERRETLGFSYYTAFARFTDDLAPVVARLAGT